MLYLLRTGEKNMIQKNQERRIMPSEDELKTGKWIYYFGHWKLAEEIFPTVNPTYPWYLRLSWWIERIVERIIIVQRKV